MFALSPFDNKTSSRSPKTTSSLRGPIKPLAPRPVLTACGPVRRVGGPERVRERAGAPVPGVRLLRKDGDHLPGDVFVDGDASVEEDDDPDHRGGNEHLCVHAQPGEVQADLLPKVLPAARAKPNTGQFSLICPTGQTCVTSPPRLKWGPPVSLDQEVETGEGALSQGHQVWGCSLLFLRLPPPFCAPGKVGALPSVTPRPGDMMEGPGSCRLHRKSCPAKDRHELQPGKPSASDRKCSWHLDEPQWILRVWILVYASPQDTHS